MAGGPGITPQERAPGHTWLPPALVALVAVAAHAWALWLPFQLDDFSVVGQAPRWLARTAGCLVGGTVDAGSPYLFRPTSWALYTLELGLSGAVAAPWIFHLGSVLLHGLAALLVWLAARRLLGAGPALVAGLFFGMHPAGSQAVSWVAARADLLLGLGGLLALLAASGTAGPRPRLAACASGLALGFALCSKVSGLVLLPAGALLAVVWPGSPREGRGMRLMLCLLPVAGAFALRWCFTGGALPGYAGGAEVSAAWAGRLLAPAALGDALRQLLVPWNLAPGATAPLGARALQVLGATGPWQAQVLALLLCLPAFLLAPLLDPRRQGRRALALGAAVVWLLLPALFVRRPGPDTAFSRLLYLPAIPLSLLLASGLAAADRVRGRAGPAARGAGLILVGLVLLNAAAAQVHTARVQLLAGEAVRGRLRSLEEAAEASGPEVTMLVLDPVAGLAGQPVLHEMVEAAARPPFREHLLQVHHLENRTLLRLSGVLARAEGPLRVLEAQEGRYEPLSPVLPPLVRDLPALHPVEAGWWRPRGPLVPRAVRLLALPLEGGPGVRLEVELQVDGKVLRRAVQVAEDPGRRRATLVLDEDLPYLMGVRLEGLRPAAGAPGLAGPPELHGDVPVLEAVYPRDGAALSMARDGLAFAVRAPPAGAELVLRGVAALHGRPLELVAVYPPERQQPLGEGLVGLPPSGGLNAAGWQHLEQGFRELLTPWGITALPLWWRVEAHVPAGGLEARSPWRRLLLRE